MQLLVTLIVNKRAVWKNTWVAPQWIYIFMSVYSSLAFTPTMFMFICDTETEGGDLAMANSLVLSEIAMQSSKYGHSLVFYFAEVK